MTEQNKQELLKVCQEMYDQAKLFAIILEKYNLVILNLDAEEITELFKNDEQFKSVGDKINKISTTIEKYN